MPLCSVHLLSFTPGTTLQSFLSTLKSANISPLVISRVIRWIILPKQLSTSELLARNIHWDILLILSGTSSLPSPILDKIAAKWSVVAGVPSKIVENFTEKNKKFLKPDVSKLPKVEAPMIGKKEKKKLDDAASAQNLEMDPELEEWIARFSNAGTPQGSGPVSMLNLLSFLPDKKSSYLQYGAAFGSKVGKKFGGNAKVVGTVVDGGPEEGNGVGWNEIALAQYPSILHFRAMLRDTEYQEANRRFRLPALRDTFILCTSEVGLEDWEKARL